MYAVICMVAGYLMSKKPDTIITILDIVTKTNVHNTLYAERKQSYIVFDGQFISEE